MSEQPAQPQDDLVVTLWVQAWRCRLVELPGTEPMMRIEWDTEKAVDFAERLLRARGEG
jgi:hypothetical protein